MVEFFENVATIDLKREVDESYPILIGTDLFLIIAEDLKEKPLGTKHAIITDSNVGPLHAGKLESVMREQGLDARIFTIPAGEANKTIENCMQVIGKLSQSRLGRDSCILALGGGVVGDMAGFIAAIYNRGVPYIQIPTTLLAQADSCIGGKTAVDTYYGKNLVGAFKQPSRVYIDLATLNTLFDREYRMGFAETIKHGIIQGPSLIHMLEEQKHSILSPFPLNEEAIGMLYFVSIQNCLIKGTVVEQDPHEKGLRRILNYGHTVGHALEKVSQYQIPHGHAVSMGMMVAGRISHSLGHFPLEDLERQEQLLHAYGLPTEIPHQLFADHIIDATMTDKKVASGKVRYTLPLKIGEMLSFDGAYATSVEREVVEDAIEAGR